MNKYYRIFICGLLGLFLTATGTFAVAAPQHRTQDRKAFKDHVAFQKKDRKAFKDHVAAPQHRTQDRKAFKDHAASQKKRKPAEKSLIRPSVKHDSVKRHNYRQNTAREALKSGRIVSLAVIRKQVRQSFPGKIVDVRLLESKRKNQSYIYKVKVLRKDGKLLELKINAANGRIVGVKGNK